MDKNLNYPIHNYYEPGSNVTVNSRVHIHERGQDPKPMVLELCKPMCVYWKDKLARCEKKLQTIIKINPTKTCLYPMRDWTTCVEACAQPKIMNNLVGTEDSYQEII